MLGKLNSFAITWKVSIYKHKMNVSNWKKDMNWKAFIDSMNSE